MRKCLKTWRSVKKQSSCYNTYINVWGTFFCSFLNGTAPAVLLTRAEDCQSRMDLPDDDCLAFQWADVSDTHTHPVHSLWHFPPVYIILRLQMLLSGYPQTAMHVLRSQMVWCSLRSNYYWSEDGHLPDKFPDISFDFDSAQVPASVSHLWYTLWKSFQPTTKRHRG